MRMGGGIQKQGIPFEVGKIKELRQQAPSIVALPRNFKTFDAFDPTTGTAYSIKTLDAITGARLMKPRQLYSTLKKYIDDTVLFEKDPSSSYPLTQDRIKSRKLELALPAAISNSQMEEIAGIIAYAKQHGVKVILTFVR